jgi:hypothetical protein
MKKNYSIFGLLTLLLLTSCEKKCTCDTTPKTLSDGLVAHYPFNQNANDESGNGLNATVNGATLTSDRFGKSNSAYEFTTNQDINVPNTENKNLYPVTISLWYNASQLTENTPGNIFSKYVSASWNGMQIILGDFRQVANNNAIESDGFGVASWYVKSTTNKVLGYYGEAPFLQKNIFANTWYHYVFSLDETGGKIYVNGTLVSTHAWTGAPGITSNNYKWKIGGSYDNGWFKGVIDDIRIYNRVLTQSEITYLATN